MTKLVQVLLSGLMLVCAGLVVAQRTTVSAQNAAAIGLPRGQ